MVDNQSQSQALPSESAQAPERKPGKAYQRPRILSREPLEAMAVTCGGAYGKVQGICQTGSS
jgi:hypothetical protein